MRNSESIFEKYFAMLYILINTFILIYMHVYIFTNKKFNNFNVDRSTSITWKLFDCYITANYSCPNLADGK